MHAHTHTVFGGQVTKGHDPRVVHQYIQLVRGFAQGRSSSANSSEVHEVAVDVGDVGSIVGASRFLHGRQRRLGACGRSVQQENAAAPVGERAREDETGTRGAAGDGVCLSGERLGQRGKRWLEVLRRGSLGGLAIVVGSRVAHYDTDLSVELRLLFFLLSSSSSSLYCWRRRRWRERKSQNFSIKTAERVMMTRKGCLLFVCTFVWMASFVGSRQSEPVDRGGFPRLTDECTHGFGSVSYTHLTLPTIYSV